LVSSCLALKYKKWQVANVLATNTAAGMSKKKKLLKGATTLSITTKFIMTLSIKGSNVTLSISYSQHILHSA